MSDKIYLFSILLFLIISGGKAQDIDSWIETNEKIPVEKIYVHTDRDFYFTEETIWLKSYLTDSRSGRLIPGAENIFMQLIDQNGNAVLKTNLMSINGQAPGHIQLPDTLKSGNYVLRANTDYLLNFGEESFFHKTIIVSRPARSLRALESRRRSAIRRMAADVSFFPEGGKLLEGVSNLVAFKATDANGFGVEVKGSLRDNSGTEVGTFNSDYKGMGIFFMTPERGKSYHAVINGFPGFRFSFDSLTATEGVKIQLVNQTSRDLILNIAANSGRFNQQPFYLVGMYRGNVIFYQPFQMEGQNQLLKFDSEVLKGGINQLILLDNNLRPISERLIFSDNFELKEIEISTDKKTYTPRSSVNLELSENGTSGEISNLSVTVFHEAAFTEKNVSQNILSYLLIDSELNGFIESPADYFIDNEYSAQAKQYLLMLTHGWSGYFWNSVPVSGNELKHRQTAGLELHGMASDISSGQPLKNGEITLVLEKDGEMAFLTQTTDKQGKFTFPGLLFNDTANVYVQAKSQRGRQNTNISLFPSTETPPSVAHANAMKGDFEIPADLEKQKYNHVLEMEKYLRKQGAVRITSNQPENQNHLMNDGHFRIYDRADQVIVIPENEGSYANVLDYLAGKVAGLDISGDHVSLRGTSNIHGNPTPLFLLDGIPLNTRQFSPIPEEIGINVDSDTREAGNSSVDNIKGIPLGDIEKVEILKTPQNLALFGVEGANGVIAIYTRKGKSDFASLVTKGVLAKKIAGYASSRKFYSPKYSPENMPETPDFRTTLFWEPDVLLQNETGLTFFTSDQTGRYKVIVEGISETGRICVGNAWFEVE
jgi:hypothetical protein